MNETQRVLQATGEVGRTDLDHGHHEAGGQVEVRHRGHQVVIVDGGLVREAGRRPAEVHQRHLSGLRGVPFGVTRQNRQRTKWAGRPDRHMAIMRAQARAISKKIKE